jgi:DNA (cytosine-5)-methyltransferase 1
MDINLEIIGRPAGGRRTTFTPPPRPANGYRLLDVCSKAGGAGLGYHMAGFEVISVDREPQPNQPFPFIQADLRDLDPEWIAANFDAVVGSPPCWSHSDLKHRTGREYEDFIPETRELFKATGLPYVIENVEGAPLIDPLVLCGTQFPGLRVSRHRLFESSTPLKAPMPHPKGKHPLHFTHDKRKKHYGKLNEWTAFVQVTGGGNCTKAAAEDAMGIPSGWMSKEELNQAIPPRYTEWIGRQITAHLNVRKVTRYGRG